MKLLVVEDDQKTMRLLKQGLGEHGFVVDGCDNGVDGLESALSQAYNLIILDVMLPEMDGWDVLAQLRTSDRNTPVVMLTAREAVEHRVRGLTSGADDYLTKPFAVSELLARINTILKRRQQVAPDDLTRNGGRFTPPPSRLTEVPFSPAPARAGPYSDGYLRAPGSRSAHRKNR